MLWQLECEKNAAKERVKRAEVYDATLEERAREQAAQLAEVRDKESQHRATAAQMRFHICFWLSGRPWLYIVSLCIIYIVL